MELKSLQAQRLEFSEDILQEFYCERLKESFVPSNPESSFCHESTDPTLFSLHLYKTLDWLHEHDLPKPLEKNPCITPLLLFVPNFNINHLLFHYDGSPNSSSVIHGFIDLFSELIKGSKATIISPSFVPKSKIKEEQEIIKLVVSSVQETSFIKFNFSKIGDFWSYCVQNDCTLLVTSKNYQAELAKVLFHFYKGKIWSDQLSFYLGV